MNVGMNGLVFALKLLLGSVAAGNGGWAVASVAV